MITEEYNIAGLVITEDYNTAGLVITEMTFLPLYLKGIVGSSVVQVMAEAANE